MNTDCHVLAPFSLAGETTDVLGDLGVTGGRWQSLGPKAGDQESPPGAELGAHSELLLC